ncbi:hypothetical protein D3C85_1636550 [compost metagenome]
MHLGVALGDHLLHELKLADRLARLMALARTLRHLVHQADRRPDAQARQVDALLVQRPHGRAKALPFHTADDGALVDPHTVEHHVTHR